MKLKIKDIIGKHKDTPGVIVASGPSLIPYKTKIEELSSNKKIIVFNCNDWESFMGTCGNYWILANTNDTPRKYKDSINKHKMPIFWADSVDLGTPEEWALNELTEDFLPYDQRHFNKSPCSPISNCCHKVDTSRLTIQEELQLLSGHPDHYGTGDTVVVHMIAFAILMKCNPIYICGLDLDFSLGYANPNIPLNSPPAEEDPGKIYLRPRVERDLRILNESAKLLGINIITTTPNPWYNQFKVGVLDI